MAAITQTHKLPCVFLLYCTSFIQWLAAHTAALVIILNFKLQIKNIVNMFVCVCVLFFIFLQVSLKPELVSHAEAASIPYVASTALSALVNAGGLCRDSSSDKRQE